MKLDGYARRLARRIGRTETRRVVRQATRRGKDPERVARKRLRG